ncbi:peptidase inhibitor family I36 protein [Actinoplanes siamensis]|uniref:Peptidase inhibitor family I36 n=1 Tax=Actinoplanes siamensis TaxID=1223317 RepID=A0A919N9A8_9ACTN|nr:peptidase inhibitor family I36 protein [Actinoplanes siamensis]GIF06883.1 hypothetical protein Asi03nite_44210 [Actinoplanes siamensis]
MKTRMAMLAALAVLGAAVSAPGTAYAGARDNEDARVSGVRGVPAEPCPSQYFCLYTRSNHSGQVFKLFRCQTYGIGMWNGIGSYYNHDGGGKHAKFLDKGRKEILNIPPYPDSGHSSSRYDFRPVWYVTAC